MRHRFEQAAAFLEQAIAAGCEDANVFYLLALAFKRQGKASEARTALARIASADANVWLQMGILALQQNVGRTGPSLQQAEQDFARAWQMAPGCYAACHNLLLTRLTLGQLDAANALIPQALASASSADEQRFLTLVQALLRACQDGQHDYALAQLTAADEERLLQVVRSLGQIDLTCTLLDMLATRSRAARRSRSRSSRRPSSRANNSSIAVTGPRLRDC